MIIGIGHVKRVGKDTAATALCRDLGFRRKGFADRLKELALEADPLVTPSASRVNISIGHGRLAWVVKGMGWDDAKDGIPEVRTFLERLGQGVRKVFGEDAWVDMALAGIKPEDNVVFADVRHPNEADAIRALGGKVIRINRPGHQPGGHISNSALADYAFDAELANDGSVLDLERAVVSLVSGWMREAEKIPPYSEIEPDPLKMQDVELPGMWEQADFTGGATGDR